MPDPFLVAHRVLPRLFLISYPYLPLSIRDQMVRGRWIIDRLLEATTISVQSECPVLVVGAGVAGVTAALRCHERGVRCVLVEKGTQPFPLQARTHTRWIDPAQYDWPATHWLRARYNATPPDVPLQFSADWADVLAAAWSGKLLQAVRVPGSFLRYEDGVKCLSVKRGRSSHSLAAAFNPPGPHKRLPSEYSAVIWAGGFPDETSYLNAPGGGRIFEGYPFWSTDPFSRSPWGVPRTTNPKEADIAIVGSGDGALQDFLRITTGCRSAVEFYRKLSLPAAVEQSVYSPADSGQRHWLSGRDNQHDHRFHSEIDKRYRRVAETLLGDPAFRTTVQQQLSSNQPNSIRIFYPCYHLTAFYGLNRFLTYLVAGFLRIQWQQHVLKPGWRLVDVQPDPVVPHYGSCSTLGYSGCIGWRHKLKFAEVTNCYPGTLGRQKDENANVVIIRAGLDKATKSWPKIDPGAVDPPKPEELLDMLLSRQHPPYHIHGPDRGGSWS